MQEERGARRKAAKKVWVSQGSQIFALGDGVSGGKNQGRQERPEEDAAHESPHSKRQADCE